MVHSLNGRLAVPFGILLLLVASTAPAVAAPPPGWAGPEVYAGKKAGPIAIGESLSIFTHLGSLAVPSGTWIAYAKFEGHVEFNAVNVTCDLVAGTGASQTRQRGYFRIGAYSGDFGAGIGSFNLEHTFGAPGGKFQLRCLASWDGATAHHIRIMAMRVGTLTKHPLAGGRSPVQGSGKPVVVHGYRTTPVAIPNSDTLTPIATMPLTAGEWWIRADFSVVIDSTTADPDKFLCRLSAGNETDTAPGRIGDDDEATMVDLNIAPSIASRAASHDVTLSCRADYGDFEARDIRITAVKAGALTRVNFNNGSTTTIGSGKPVIVHGQRFLAPYLSTSFATLGNIGLGAGKFAVSAKVNSFDGRDVKCQLRDGTDADLSYEAYPFNTQTMAMQIAGSANARRILRLECRETQAPSSPQEDPGEVRYAKVTALRVATLGLRDL